jgi:hypothetical protein
VSVSFRILGEQRKEREKDRNKEAYLVVSLSNDAVTTHVGVSVKWGRGFFLLSSSGGSDGKDVQEEFHFDDNGV